MPRMIVEIPKEVQIAIKLVAVKRRITTGRVVTDAITFAFAEDLAEAQKVIAEKKRKDLYCKEDED